MSFIAETQTQGTQVFYSNIPQAFSNVSVAQPVQAAPVASVTLGAAIKAMVTAKRASNRREVYCSEVRRFLGTFARGRENVPLASITCEQMEAWIAERDFAPSSK